MYCSNCGANLDDDSMFCPSCGTPCTPEKETAQETAVGMPVTESQTERAEQKTIDVLEERQRKVPVVPVHLTGQEDERPLVQRKSTAGNPYYVAEFAKIAAGQKSKFNWAAFFLGPFHQMYHGSIKLFKKTFLPYMVAMFLVIVVGQISALITLATFSMEALISTIVTALLYLVLAVWACILFIFNGKKYNQRLYEQVQGRAEDIPVRKKPALLLFGIYVGILIILAEILIPVIGGKMVMNAWMEDLPIDNGGIQADSSYFFTENSESSTDVSSDIWATKEDEEFSVPTVDTELQLAYTLDYEDTMIYTNGVGSGTTDGFDNVLIYGDEAVTVGELFRTMLDSFAWEQGESYDGPAYNAVGQINGDKLVLCFSQLYSANVSIASGALYQAHGDILPMSQYDIANLMYNLYQEYHTQTGTQEISLIKSIRGTWISDDGTVELTIDSETYGGNYYNIQYRQEDMILISVTRNDGTIDDRWLEISNDTLVVHDIEGRDSVGNIVGIFSRVK